MFSRKNLPKGLTAEDVFRALQGSAKAVFWLDSGTTATSGRSYLGVTDEVVCADPGRERAFLDHLRAGLSPNTRDGSDAERSSAPDTPRFTLGWVGWFSYEFGKALLGIPANYRADIPPSVMMRVRAVTMGEIVRQPTSDTWSAPDRNRTCDLW